LKRSLASALVQKETQEVIVVDNGSDDGSREFLRGLSDRIIYCRNPKNIGHSAAMNIGVQLATGDWIKPLDDDDYLAPNCIEAMKRAIDLYPRSAIGSCPAIQVDKHGRAIGRTRPLAVGNLVHVPRHEIHPRMLLDRLPFGTTSQVAFRRDAFLESGGWDEDLTVCDEIDSWIRIARFGDAFFLDSYQVYRSLWSGSSNRKSSIPERLTVNIAMKKKIYEAIDDRRRAELPSLEKILVYLTLHWLFVALKEGQIAAALFLAFPAILSPPAWKLFLEIAYYRSGRSCKNTESELTGSIGTLVAEVRS
jgi:glycosyltransferase involved in cell wall biosynthesis